MKKFGVAVFLFFVVTLTLSHAASPLKVGVLENAPPAIHQITLELWTHVRTILNVPYVLSSVQTVDEGIQQLRNRQLDILIGPLTVSPQYQGIRFLDSYITDSVSIVLPEPKIAVFQRIFSFVRLLLSATVALFAFWVICVGVLIWWVEHKKNPGQFPSRPLKGIGSGIWFALVTLTGVGYGDKTPVTLAGRVIAGVWMLVNIFALSAITAVIAAELSSTRLNQSYLKSPSDLSRRKVAYIQGDAQSLTLIRYFRAVPVAAASFDQVAQMLSAQQVRAAFLNTIEVRYFLAQNPQYQDQLQVTTYQYKNGDYSFATLEGFSLSPAIGQALFTIQESGVLQQIEDHYLGADTSVFLQN